MIQNTEFAFTADCKQLEQSIKKVSNVMAMTSQPICFLAVYKKRLCLIGLGSDAFVLLAVPNATVDKGVGAFGFAPDKLVGLIKGRSVMQFAFNGQDCSFKQQAGKYSGNIVTLPITSDQQTSVENYLSQKTTGTKLPSEVLALLKIGLSVTNIKDVYQGAALVSYVSMDRKGLLQVSSFDAQHFGLFELQTEVKSVEFRAALPVTHFGLIDQVADGLDAQFSIGSNSVRVDGKGFVVSLPATQAEDKHYQMVPSFIAAMPKPAYSCLYDNSQLMSMTENLFTLYSANTSFALQAKDSALRIQFTTPSGTAADSMKVTPDKAAKPVKAGVDPRLLKDILGLARFEKATLAINDKVLMTSGTLVGAKVTLACARAA